MYPERSLRSQCPQTLSNEAARLLRSLQRPGARLVAWHLFPGGYLALPGIEPRGVDADLIDELLVNGELEPVVSDHLLTAYTPRSTSIMSGEVSGG